MEEYPAGDNFDERMVTSDSIPIAFNGREFRLTPANAAVRLFFDDDLDDYSRVIVYTGDGSEAPFKPDDDLLMHMVNIGFPVELPSKLDETDHEFMDGFMRIWSEEASSRLRLA